MNNCLIVLLAITAIASAQLDCRGATSPIFNDWCQENCNHDPSNCPAKYCTCDGSAAPEPLLAVGGNCTSVNDMISNDWCETMCNHVPAYCPPSHCKCAREAHPDAVAVTEIAQDGCEERTPSLFFTAGESLYVKDLATEEATICATWIGGEPIGLVIAENGDIFVADEVASAIIKVPGDCSTNGTVVVSWEQDNIDVGSSVTLSGGFLYTSGATGVVAISLDANNEAVAIDATSISIYEVNDMKPGADGCVWFVERAASIVKYCPATGREVYLDVHGLGVPDIKGLDVSSTCGLIFSATDSNQVYMCTDLADSASCSRMCLTCAEAGLKQDCFPMDGFSCAETNNPYGMVFGACCEVFSANRGNGNIVHYTAPGTAGTVICDELFHPKALAYYNGGCLDTDTPLVCTPTPSVTPSSTVAPSASNTVAPSASSTVAPSASNTVAPSESSTVAPSESSTVAPSESSTVAASASNTVAPSESSTVAASASNTVAPSESETVAPSESETVAPSESASPSPVVPSPSSSESPSMSPSPSATPTNSFFFEAPFEDFASACSSNQCTGVNPNILNAFSDFARGVGFAIRYNFKADDKEADSPPCDRQTSVFDSNTGQVNFFCQRDVLDWTYASIAPQLSPADIQILVIQQAELTAPSIMAEWDVYDINTDPNPNIQEARYAARYNCAPYGNNPFVILWTPSFCWDDEDYNMNLCIQPQLDNSFMKEQPAGWLLGGVQYVTLAGTVFPETTPVLWQQVTCQVA